MLCEIVRKKPEQELKSILTDVNREIVKKEKTLEFVIRLTKNFHLTKRGGKETSKSLTNLQMPMSEFNEQVKHYNQQVRNHENSPSKSPNPNRMGLYWPSEPKIEYLPLSQSLQSFATHERTIGPRQQHSPSTRESNSS